MLVAAAATVVVVVVVDVAATQCAQIPRISTDGGDGLSIASARLARDDDPTDSILDVAVSTTRRRLYKRSYEIDSNVCLHQEKSPSKLELRLLFFEVSRKVASFESTNRKGGRGRRLFPYR